MIILQFLFTVYVINFDIILPFITIRHKHVSKLLKWLKQWSYKLKTMLKHKKQSMILGFAIDPDLL